MCASKLDSTHGSEKCAWWPVCPEFAEATGGVTARPCNFLGCTNIIIDPAFPWSMCDECYETAD